MAILGPKPNQDSKRQPSSRVLRENPPRVLSPTRRAHALVRDERRLSRAIQHYDERAFDADTRADLHSKLEDMLETLDIIASDDTFWRKIKHDSPVPQDQRERLGRLDENSLRILLGWAGYHNPPPPAVDEIVDEMIAELADALDYPSEDTISNSRRGLNSSLKRIRQQIESQPLIRADENIFRATARKTARIARWLVPKALAGAAGTLFEIHAPGSSVGLIVVYGAAKNIVEAGFDCAAVRTLRYLSEGRKHADYPESPVVFIPTRKAISNSIDSHIVAIGEALYTCKQQDLTYAERKQYAERISRHFDRIQELLDDYVPGDRRADGSSGDAYNGELWRHVDETSKKLEKLLGHLVANQIGGSSYVASTADDFYSYLRILKEGGPFWAG